MQITCPTCRETIPAADVALDKGWAKCVRCNEIFRLTEVLPGYAMVASEAAVALPERPFDAWAEVTRENRRMLVHIPALGLRPKMYPLVAFAVFGLCFMAFWTAGAAGLFEAKNLDPERIVFAAFSIPGWLMCLGLLGFIVWLSRATRNALFDEAMVVSELRCLFWKRRKVVQRDEVQCARKEAIQPLNPFSPFHAFPISPLTVFPYRVEMVFRKGPFKLPCQTEAEQQWLIAEINDFLQTVPCRPSPLLDARERL